MAFERDLEVGGIEVTVRFTEEELKIIKYAGNYGYETNIVHTYSAGPTYGNPEELIRQLLYWEMKTLQLHSGEVEKFRWKLMLEGKDPNTDLRITNPELFVKSGGIVRDKKVPHFKPRFPALLTIH